MRTLVRQARGDLPRQGGVPASHHKQFRMRSPYPANLPDRNSHAYPEWAFAHFDTPFGADAFSNICNDGIIHWPWLSAPAHHTYDAAAVPNRA